MIKEASIWHRLLILSPSNIKYRCYDLDYPEHTASVIVS